MTGIWIWIKKYTNEPRDTKIKMLLIKLKIKLEFDLKFKIC